MNDEQEKTLRGNVMEAIHKGKVRMRPRWHFVLYSALFALGALILLLTLLYVASLSFFALRESGVWFEPSFGVRGWSDLFHALPVLLIVLAVIFAFLLEIMVRHYAFVYRKPLLVSLAAILVIVLFGGFFIAQTSFHRTMALDAAHGELPPPLNMLYGPSFRSPRPPDMYRGTIEKIIPGGFILTDSDSGTTSIIMISPRTRLPYGEDFTTGEEVIVVGDRLGSSTIGAFGVREIDE